MLGQNLKLFKNRICLLYTSVLINGERIKDLEFTVKKEDAFGQSKTVIRRGKKNYFVLKYNG